MGRISRIVTVCLLVFALCGCKQNGQNDWIDATKHGLSVQNSGQQNSQALQSLIDFFFEHQGRFNSQMYTAESAQGFYVSQYRAEGNLYNFGGICAENVTYTQCTSGKAIKQEVYFENCKNCKYNE